MAFDTESSAIDGYQFEMRTSFLVTQNELNDDLHALRECGLILGNALRQVRAVLAKTNHPITDDFFTDRVIESVADSCEHLPYGPAVDLMRTWAGRQ